MGPEVPSVASGPTLQSRAKSLYKERLCAVKENIQEWETFIRGVRRNILRTSLTI
jgi:hypothetical protein